MCLALSPKGTREDNLLEPVTEKARSVDPTLQSHEDLAHHC